MERIREIYCWLCVKVNALPCVCLVIMIFATVANIISRTFFSTAMNGSYEIVRYLCLVIVVFAIPHAELEDAMVKVTFLEEWTPPKFSNTLNYFWDFVGAAAFGFVGYWYIINAVMKYRGNALSSTLHIPTWIPMVFLSFCFFLLAGAVFVKGCCAIIKHKSLPSHRIKNDDAEIGKEISDA